MAFNSFSFFKKIPFFSQNLFSHDTSQKINLPEGLTIKSENKSQQPSSSVEKRLSQRFKYQFDVVIMGKNRSVRSFTEDISEGGILINEFLPFEFNQEALEILIIVKDGQTQHSEYFLFHGKTVESHLRSRRVKFTRTVANSKEKLLELFEKFKKCAT